MAIVADRAVLEDGFVLALIAREVSGDARVLFDIRAAVVLGVVVGLAAGLFNLLVGRTK